MWISQKSFFAVGEEMKLSPDRTQLFWEQLEKRSVSSPEPRSFSKFLYYFGALNIIVMMAGLMTTAWDSFGGFGIFLLSAAYASVFTLLGHLLWKKEGMRISAGLLVTCAVCMAPLAVYGLGVYFKIFSLQSAGDQYLHFDTSMSAKWISMELATIIAGVSALYVYPFPFITAPVFCAVWFLSMDIAPVILGKWVSPDGRCWISLFFGLALIAAGCMMDMKKKRDFSFWSYLFGTLSFSGALCLLVWDKGEVILFVYCVINIIMMLLSVVFKRKVLMVFGAIGFFSYLSYLAFAFFANSILFPFVVSFIGLAFVFLGWLHQKNQDKIERKIQRLFPRLTRILRGT